MSYRDLDVLHAAELAVDRVNQLIDCSVHSARPLIHAGQLRKSVQSVNANIGEGFGRRSGADRIYRLEIARAEAEESIRHLRANFRNHRITATEYWPVHNLLVVISKMLTTLIGK